MMSRRRGDTRERIQQVALELFAERGYENTSLREVAERLEITRPALYYHFKTKEEILTGVVNDLCASVDELVEWARAQPPTPEARREILQRISQLLRDKWRPLIRFDQTNQTAMHNHQAGEQMEDRMVAITSVLAKPGDDPIQQFQARLAVIAVILGGVPFLFDRDVDDEQRSAVALEVATGLIATPQRPG